MTSRWILPLLLVTSPFCKAAESLSFIAEHVIEVPMDFRYLALPQTPLNHREPEWRIQGGYGIVNGGLTQNDVFMTGLQYYSPSTNGNGYLFSFFLDQLNFSGAGGTATAKPFLQNYSSIPPEFSVQVNDIDGRGYHFGATAAYQLGGADGSSFQYGLVIEQLRISSYKVSFRSLNLASNFSGYFDYSGVYNALTPFISYQWPAQARFENWSSVARVVGALPLPRVGFEERFIAPGIDQSSNEGKHIPDAYIGVSYTFEHVPSGWRIDVGGAFYSLLIEPIGHSDIESSFSINASKSW